MIPRLILELSGLAYSIGSDPFLDSEHSTSWQKHDHNKTLIEIKKFIDLKCKNFLDFNKYSKITEYENSTFIPKR